MIARVYPDILSKLRLGRAHADLRAEFTTANRELASGTREDVYAATGGDPGRLSSLDRSLARVGARQPLLAMAKARAEAAGVVIDGLRSSLDGIGVEAVDAAISSTAASRSAVAARLDGALASTLTALNSEVWGRPLFGGAETDASPFDLTGLGQFRTDVATDVAAAAPTDAAGIVAAFDAAFDAHWTTLYAGGGASATVEIADGQRLDYAMTADDPALKATVRDLALGAWSADLAALAAAPVADREVLQIAGGRLVARPDDLVGLRANLGLSEQRLEEAATRAAAERTTLEMRRNDLVGVDQYETASRVLELESRIQALYEVTARAARLSFLDFMR